MQMATIMEAVGNSRESCIRIIRKQRRYPSKDIAKKSNLTLFLIEQCDIPKNDFFNTMMNQHHYLGMAKHHAAEIRYLVRDNTRWIAAVSFGSAAWACADRDRWIGWNASSRTKNLPKIVNNTRFLINPNIKGMHLASQVLSLVSKRVRQDWKARYGQDIVMLETFVDEKYDGACYKASNWVEVGKTKGRGKWDPHHKKNGSIKKIFVYPLVSNVYAPLEGKHLQKTEKHWVEKEFETFTSSDARLNKRLKSIAKDFYANPTANIPQSCNSRAKTKAAYRFFNHKDVTMECVLDAHYQSTFQRLKKENVVLAVQDSTSFNYSTHNNPELGTLSTSTKREGIMVHDTMAFTEKGVPLGLIDVQTWERDPAQYGKKSKRAKVPIEEKESYKWLKSYQALIPIQSKAKGTRIVSVGDREADLYELFERVKNTHSGPDILVRARHDRKLKLEESFLWESMALSPVAGHLTINVPRKPGKKQRTAVLAISYKAVTLKKKNQNNFVTLFAVYARELNQTLVEDPISWMLLTSIEVASLADAIEKVSWYMIRWQIEIYHKIIKSGCRVESRQAENLKPLKACIALDLVVAWRIFYMTKLSRENSDLSSTVCFKDHEWKALCCYHQKKTKAPEEAPLLKDAIRMIAEIGGFQGRKSDGDPGSITIWRGMITLATVIECYCMFNPP